MSDGVKWLMRLLRIERHDRRSPLTAQVYDRVRAADAVIEDAQQAKRTTERAGNELANALWHARDRIGATEGGERVLETQRLRATGNFVEDRITGAWRPKREEWQQ